MRDKPAITLDQIRETKYILDQHLELPASIPAKDAEAFLNALKQILSDQIAYLMDYQPERLMNILYRIDVDEEAFRDVVRKVPPDQIPGQVAELIIQRQLDKVKWREWFRNRER